MRRMAEPKFTAAAAIKKKEMFSDKALCVTAWSARKSARQEIE